MRIYLDNSDQVFGHIAVADEVAILEREDPSLRGRLTVDADDLVALEAKQTRAAMRRDIEAGVGDTASILGTTADAAAILLEQVGRGFAALATAQSLADVRAAAQPLADLLAPFVAGVDDGTVKLPHMVKGDVAATLGEISARCTSIAYIMYAQQAGQSE